MLSELALFAANRATNGAVGHVTRRISWGAVAIIFLACAIIFGAVAINTYLEPWIGRVGAPALVAAGAIILAAICISAPAVFEALEKRAEERAKRQTTPIASAVEAVSKETEAAVDYFGPLQVVSTAFLVGLRTGRHVRGEAHPSRPAL